LQKSIEYTFKNKSILKTALTHSSYANEHKNNGVVCNERLEFLGDSVLGFICAELLYNKFKSKPEGELSKMRSSLVCESALCEYAKDLKLGNYLLLGHGEILAAGQDRPSTLSDAFEALIAAIYLDGGIEPAKKFVLPYLNKAIDADSITHLFSRDYKTALQEIAQKNPGELISYVIADETGPDHNKLFTVNVYLNSNLLASGTGKSKKEAEQEAARKALNLMGEE
jgi:ribonuclease-3